MRAAHDVGRAINPQAAEGQIEGGVAMGLGFALMEEVVVEEGSSEPRPSSSTCSRPPSTSPRLSRSSSRRRPPWGRSAPKDWASPHLRHGGRGAERRGRRHRRAHHPLPLTAENVYLALEAAGYVDGEPPTALARPRRRPPS